MKSWNKIPLGHKILIISGVVLIITLSSLFFVFVIKPSIEKSLVAVKVKSEDFVITEMTVGNHTWIPVNQHVNWYSEEPPMIVLSLVDKFEKRHPELEITGWRTHGNQTGAQTLHGLWIDHRPKK